MTSEPSTSTDIAISDRNTLLQQALSQAGVIRVQRQKLGTQQKTQRQISDISAKITIHPLMPIVELLFLKCEKAAYSLSKSHFEMADVVKLFKELEEQGIQCSTDDSEIDDLVTKAILALRTCLVELERVYMLSQSFKSKYLATLKRNICHEALIGSNVDSDDDLGESSSNLAEDVPATNSMETSVATLQTASGKLSIPLHISQQSITMIPATSVFERNMEFLRKLGFPGSLPTKFEDNNSEVPENSTEKSEEEKQLLCELSE